MNKLEERFESICDEDKWPWIMAVDCAKEAKDIAIEFEKWMNRDFIRQPFTDMYQRMTPDQNVWPLNFNKVSREEIFDYFIEERYNNIKAI
jgi:hypothetical protein